MFQGAEAEISAQLRLFAEQTHDFVGVADPWGRILYLNPAARKRLGVADASELSLTDVFPVEEFAIYYEVARPQLLRTGSWSGQIRVNVAGEGAVPMYVSTTATLGPGGEINGLVVHAREVPGSHPVGETGELEIDDATGLLARSAFEHQVRLALAVAERDGDHCALVLVDIVGMRDTIEMFGEVAAVKVLHALAGRVSRLARTIDAVGRVGEQRLGLLLRSVRSPSEALRIARMVHESLIDPPVIVAGGEVVPSVASGAAFSRPRDDTAALIERAGAALSYPPADSAVAASIAGAGRSDSSATMDEFRLGFSRRQLRPYAQPVVELGSGRVVAYRGLARWEHPRLGTLKAAEFIDMISETPLAGQVDLYVARETAAVITLLLRDDPLYLYTPVSKRLIADVRTEQYLSEIADAYFLSMSQMRLQIAARLLESWSPALRDAMLSLSDVGIPLVLTGVEAVPDALDVFSELHLSTHVCGAVAVDAAARSAVSEIVRAAHDRGLLVLAAGVDGVEERDVLIELGCDLAHGDLFGPPEPADNID